MNAFRVWQFLWRKSAAFFFMWMLASLAFFAQTLHARECQKTTFDGAPFTFCLFLKPQDDIRLFHADERGEIFSNFSALAQWLDAQGLGLDVAMNGGMFHPDRSPVGHYKAKDVILRALITSPGPGNFGMLPNGVFCINPTRAEIFETKAFAARAQACEYATQSGPLLVIEGRLHPRFRKESTSRYVRNGVGTDEEGRKIVFAISDMPVNLHHFARFFRDGLGLNNALYIDGGVSRFHAEALMRSDFGFPMGPILAVVSPFAPLGGASEQ